MSPKMWSELWVGWFTVWGDDHAANKSAAERVFFFCTDGRMLRAAGVLSRRFPNAALRSVPIVGLHIYGLYSYGLYSYGQH